MSWQVAWYGMVWYGMVWYGMVWYGVDEPRASLKQKIQDPMAS